jgi:hypothetical protein
MYISISVFTHVERYIYMYVYICIHIYIHIYIYIYIYISIYEKIYMEIDDKCKTCLRLGYWFKYTRIRVFSYAI